jgi:hypothetical protein
MNLVISLINLEILIPSLNKSKELDKILGKIRREERKILTFSNYTIVTLFI